MNEESNHLRDLGIPDDYGSDPFRPRYTEAATLVDVEINIVGRMQRLVESTARDWQAMKAEASKDHIELLLVSGFRSIDHQTELIRKKLVAGQVISDILDVSAAPGFSQHHTGQTVDLATPGARPLTLEFENMPAFEWLRLNAERFRFRMPYTKDNRFGFAYEPWHWTQIED